VGNRRGNSRTPRSPRTCSAAWLVASTAGRGHAVRRAVISGAAEAGPCLERAKRLLPVPPAPVSVTNRLSAFPNRATRLASSRFLRQGAARPEAAKEFSERGGGVGAHHAPFDLPWRSILCRRRTFIGVHLIEE
jgi:hypothetical protein